jgi:hypothetical protein
MEFLYCKLCCTGGLRCPMGKHFLEFPAGGDRASEGGERLHRRILQSFPIGQRNPPVQERVYARIPPYVFSARRLPDCTRGGRYTITKILPGKISNKYTGANCGADSAGNKRPHRVH